MLLYHDADQQQVIHRVKERMEADKGLLETEISPSTPFFLAESRHQKYYLKRYPDALVKLTERYPTEEELMNATLAARLNGLAKGYTNLARIVDEIGRWPMSDSERTATIELIRGIRW
jgi:Peptide methionine sulfoxide reductase